MELFPIKFTLKGGAPFGAVVLFGVLGLVLNFALLFLTALVVGLGLRVAGL